MTASPATLAAALFASILAAAPARADGVYQPNDCSYAPASTASVVISHPSVVLHFWGAYWQTGAGATQAWQEYAAWSYIAARAEFYAPLFEYSTTSAEVTSPQTIHAGSFGGADYLAQTNGNAVFYKSDIQNGLTAAGITGDPIGAPVTIHVVVLAPGAYVKYSPGGFHENFSNTSGRRVVYAAINGYSPVWQAGTDQVISHEVYEAITDPYVSSSGAGWHNAAGEEVADTCPNDPMAFGGYTVSQVYSQSSCSCVQAVDPAPPANGFGGALTAPSCAASSVLCDGGSLQFTCSDPSGAPLEILRGSTAGFLPDELGVLPAGATTQTWNDYPMTDAGFYYQACAFNDAGARACSTPVLGSVSDCANPPQGTSGGGGGSAWSPPPPCGTDGHACLLQ